MMNEQFIENEIKQTISEIIYNNGYDNSFFNAELFDKAIDDENFKITEYQIGKIYALAEIYFKIMQKPTCYGSIIELIVTYDTKVYQ